ncbi:hypothetical protein LAUMK35_05822 [Mycobacterium pseudokansasii]|nr:hypothetical protein LAUMK35_05822 [Mycobacterium pseudokansasii]VBA36161.1 hypothetical protein LAUMK21_05801 [Mycobacterium pseudokansasii]
MSGVTTKCPIEPPAACVLTTPAPSVLKARHGQLRKAADCVYLMRVIIGAINSSVYRAAM